MYNDRRCLKETGREVFWLENLKWLGFCAFIGTGVGLIISSAVKQGSSWLVVLAVVAVGYLFGLVNHYHSLRS
jgi:hypothetical protein